jgi:TolB-like protein/DNA-binding winged helix-turn-helix (wHTH) protein/Tfp pilus assembly protein PilF
VDTQLANLVRFADFEFDLRTGQLRRGGVLLKLQQQPAKVLALLISRHGGVVTRQELAQAIWDADTFVDFEQGLNFAIRNIRSALGDDAEHPRFLQTLPKLGYRFIMAVQDSTGQEAVSVSPASNDEVNDVPAKRPGIPKMWLAVASIIALLLIAVAIRYVTVKASANRGASAAIQSIAVLPLVNLSSDPEQAYFSDGMTDELITDLAKIGKLKVISHTSVERYKGTKNTVREIAQELGVDAVIEGTVMRSGDRVRISAQLIDARSDQHLWAESYERDLKDIFALQNEVAQRIASEVGITLTSDQKARLRDSRTIDPEAHELYLRGNVYSNLLNCHGWAKGLTYYQEAITKDPNYALAHLGAGDSYFHLADSACLAQSGAFEKSRAAAQRALQLDPGLGKIHILLGKLAFYHDWDWAGAEKEYAQALRFDANDAEAHAAYAIFLVAMNRREQGLAEINIAHQLDPVSEYTNMIFTYVLYLAHQYDQSVDQAKKTLELYPRSGSSYYWLGQAYERKGMYEQAANAYMTSATSGGVSQREWLQSSRRAFQKGGIVGYWQRQSLEKQNQGPGGTCWKSFLYAHMGDRERTLQWLDWGFQHHCDGLQFLKAEPIYEYLQDDPRFKKLITQLRL